MKRQALDDIKNEIDSMIKDIIDQIKDGRIDSETSITDRFMGRLQDFRYYKTYYEQVFYNWKDIDFQFLISVRTLGDRGRESPESKYGADICIIMDIHDEQIVRKKGVLIQSKLNKNPFKIVKRKNSYLHINFDSKKFGDINEQLNKMNQITSENYILVYDLEGFYISKGGSIMNPEQEKKKISVKIEEFGDFLIKMIKCLRGDLKLTEWTDDYFERLIQSRLAYYFVQIKIFQNPRF